MNAPVPEYQPQLSLWVRQLLTVILLIAGVYILTLIAPVLPMLTIAFLIAFVMFVPSRYIARRTPIPYAITVILLYALLIVMLVLGLLVITPTLLSGINNLLASLQSGYSQLITSIEHLKPEDAVLDILGVRVDMSDIVTTIKNALSSGASASTSLTPEQLANPIRVQQATLGSLINQILPLFGSVSQTVTSAVGSITGFIGSFLLAVFVSFLVLLDIPITQHVMARQIPDMYHREFAVLVHKLVHVWNGFFRGQVLIGFAIGVLTFIQLSWMGISNTFILAVITGTISLIPTIGGIFALVPLGLIPLIQGSSTFPDAPRGLLALLVVGINLVISQLIWNVIAPKILGDALDLPLPVIIVGVFIGAASAGVLGAFLAAPVMATLRVLMSYIWHKVNQEDPFPDQPAPFEWDEDSFAYGGRFRLPPLTPIARTWGSRVIAGRVSLPNRKSNEE
ncbi:MAG: AI-2E family transporter [Chloroflexi bacterium]|nr:AI-2E family transporter [Chloroflexota bacterium]